MIAGSVRLITGVAVLCCAALGACAPFPAAISNPDGDYRGTATRFQVLRRTCPRPGLLMVSVRNGITFYKWEYQQIQVSVLTSGAVSGALPGVRLTGTYDGTIIQGDVTDGQCGLHFYLEASGHLNCRADQIPLETIRAKRQYHAMTVETEAIEHLQHAAQAARDASRVLATSTEARRNTALRTMATSLRDHRVEILTANASDLGAYSGTNAFRDRLTLNEARVDSMAQGLDDIAALPDPVEPDLLADWMRPNGLRIQRIATRSV